MKRITALSRSIYHRSSSVLSVFQSCKKNKHFKNRLTNVIFVSFTLTVTTTPSPGSGHARKCNETQKAYCVNGGDCYFIDGIKQLSCKWVTPHPTLRPTPRRPWKPFICHSLISDLSLCPTATFLNVRTLTTNVHFSAWFSRFQQQRQQHSITRKQPVLLTSHLWCILTLVMEWRGGVLILLSHVWCTGELHIKSLFKMS